MNEIKLFSNPEFGEIRTVVNESGDPLFVGNDIAKILGYAYPANAIQDHVDIEDKSIMQLSDIQDVDKTPHLKGSKITMVNESGLYSLVFGSTLETAKQFKKWVTSDVLPAIRKSGGYIVTKEEDTPDIIMARGMVAAMDAIERLKKDNAEKDRKLMLSQKQLEHQAPLIQYANEVLSSTSGHNATTIGAELNMSAVTLNRLLVKAHLIRKTGKKGEYSLCASHQGKGYVVTDTKKYRRPDETVGSKIEITYTEMGRMKIHEITKRAISAGVLRVEKGRYFINNSWIPAEKQS